VTNLVISVLFIYLYGDVETDDKSGDARRTQILNFILEYNLRLFR